MIPTIPSRHADVAFPLTREVEDGRSPGHGAEGRRGASEAFPDARRHAPRLPVPTFNRVPPEPSLDSAPQDQTAAGEGFVDPGDGHVHLLRNETGAPARRLLSRSFRKT